MRVRRDYDIVHHYKPAAAIGLLALSGVCVACVKQYSRTTPLRVMVLFVHKINLFRKHTSRSSALLRAHTHSHTHQRVGNILLYFMCIHCGSSRVSLFANVVFARLRMTGLRVLTKLYYYTKCVRTNIDDHQFRCRANNNNDGNNNRIRLDIGSPTRW